MNPLPMLEKPISVTALSLSPKVRAVAELLKRFNPQELAQVVALVPDLRMMQSPQDNTLIDYFYQLGLAQRSGQPAQDEDLFIDGVTYAQYSALSEAEQDALWAEWLSNVALSIEEIPEVDVRADAKLLTR